MKFGADWEMETELITTTIKKKSYSALITVYLFTAFKIQSVSSFN